MLVHGRFRDMVQMRTNGTVLYGTVLYGTSWWAWMSCAIGLVSVIYDYESIIHLIFRGYIKITLAKGIKEIMSRKFWMNAS